MRNDVVRALLHTRRGQVRRNTHTQTHAHAPPPLPLHAQGLEDFRILEFKIRKIFWAFIHNSSGKTGFAQITFLRLCAASEDFCKLTVYVDFNLIYIFMFSEIAEIIMRVQSLMDYALKAKPILVHYQRHWQTIGSLLLSWRRIEPQSQRSSHYVTRR